MVEKTEKENCWRPRSAKVVFEAQVGDCPIRKKSLAAWNVFQQTNRSVGYEVKIIVDTITT